MKTIAFRKLGVKPLLSPTSFEIPMQSVLGVYGPNGSGKSTLLKAFSGIREDHEVQGEVWIENQLIHSEMTAFEKAKWVLYLSSDFDTPFQVTVRDLLEMGAKARSADLWPEITHAERTRMSEVIEVLGLIPFLSRTISTLSDGERQLVMFARGLIQMPKVLVLDETFSKMDLDRLLQLAKVIEAYREKGMTFIIVAHDLNFLSEVSTQLLLMKASQVLSLGTVSEVLTPLNLQILYPQQSIQIVKSAESGKTKILY